MSRSRKRRVLFAGLTLVAVAAVLVVRPSRILGWLLRAHPMWFRVGRAMEPIRNRPQPNMLTPDVDGRVRKSLAAMGRRAVPVLIEYLADKDHFVGVTAQAALTDIGRPAVPGLLGGLRHWNREVRRGCAGALGHIGDPRAVPRLLDCLNDSSPWVRDEAVSALAQMAGQSRPVLTTLVERLGDHDPDVRRGAAEALGWADEASAEVVPPLLKALGDADSTVRAAAAESLGALKPADERVLSALVACMGDPDTEVVRVAAGALGRLTEAVNPSDEARSALVSAIAGKDEGVSNAAASSLASFGTAAAPAVPELVRYLTDERWSVRRNAAVALRGIGPPAKSAAPALRGLLKDNQADVRDEAALALARLAPSADVAKLLIDRLGQAQTGRRAAIAAALGEMGPRAVPAVPALTRCLDGPDEGDRIAAVRALRQVGPAAASAAPALLAFMRSKAWAQGMLPEGTEAGEALGRLGPAAVPVLMGALNDQNDTTRHCVAEALVDIGPASVPALVKALGSKDLKVRQSAAEALTQLGPLAAPATPTFGRWLDDRDADTRHRAVHALGAIGPRAVAAGPELLKLLTDPDDRIPGCAIGALGDVGYAAAGPSLLVPVLGGGPTGSRLTAIVALGKMGYRPAVPTLKKQAHDPAIGVRIAVGQALCRLGATDPGVPVLIECLGDANTTYQREAAEALGEAGAAAREAVPELTKLTTSSDLWLRATAAAALLRMGEKDTAVPVLIDCLGCNLTNAQEVAARALGEARVKSAAPHLQRLLSQRRPTGQTRRIVTEAVARLENAS
ncbi:MAG: HEAT repeat domain-containing protein [Armatimonadetes bacterium]|nr:HEAT repeat domain-containing protein [Armatimonadota bacterium]